MGGGEVGSPGVGVPGGPAAKLSRQPETKTASEFNLFEWSDDFKARAALDLLQSRLAEVGLADTVVLRLRQQFRDLTFGRVIPAQGRYFRGVIEVALTASDRNWVLNHEIIHALRDYGLLKPGEWRTLERAVRVDKQRMASIRRRYGPLGLNESELLEEAIADGFAAWARGNSRPGAAVRSLYERIRDFFRALGRALTGASFRSVDELFAAIDAGEIGRRAREDRNTATSGKFAFGDSGVTGVEKYSLPDADEAADSLDTYMQTLAADLDSWARSIVSDYVRYLPAEKHAELRDAIAAAGDDGAAKVEAVAEALGVTLQGRPTPANLSKAVKDSFRRLNRDIATMAEERQKEAEADFLENMIAEPREPGRETQSPADPERAFDGRSRSASGATASRSGRLFAVHRALLHPYQIATRDAEFADVSATDANGQREIRSK